MSFAARFKTFNALLNFRSNANNCASAGFSPHCEKLASVWSGLMPHNVLILPFCSAAAITAAAPSPMPLLSRLTEVSGLLKNRQ